MTFKDVKSMTWEETFQKIRRLISLEFIRHNELETSSVLTAYEKNNIIFLPETAGMKSIVRWVCSFYHYCFISIMKGNVSLSLMNMTHPSSRAYLQFLSEIVNFMRNFSRRTQGQSTPCLWLSYRNTACSKGKYLQRHEQSENLFYSR